tara:strand:- start:149 stop:400 length:252 start_codon:yes stop_codon:yes gene_type:complete
MIKIILITFVFVISISNKVYSEENCSDFKKFSMNYMKCKAASAKNKAVSAGKNFIQDTKEFQNKEWSDEKEKINEVKKKAIGE